MTVINAKLRPNEVTDVQRAMVRGSASEMGLEKEFNHDVDFIRDLIKTRAQSGDKAHAAFLLAMMYVQLEQQA